MLDAVAIAGATDPHFDRAHAEQTSRHAYIYAKPATIEELRAREREYGAPDWDSSLLPKMPEWMIDAPGADGFNAKTPPKTDTTTDSETVNLFPPGFYGSLAELHAKETEPAEDLMVGVRRRQVTIFASVTNVGKTTVMLNHCLAAAGGQRWSPLLPDAPKKPLKVVFIDGESTDDELKQDTLVMLRSIGNAEIVAENFIPVVDAQIDGQALDLTNKKHFEAVRRFLKYHQPDIAVFDTLTSLFSLYNENDNAEVVRKITRPLKELANAGNCAVMASIILASLANPTTQKALIADVAPRRSGQTPEL